MALSAAAACGHLAVVAYLLDQGAPIDRTCDDGWTALFWACHKGHAAVARLLLQRGADPALRNTIFFTPLMVASFYGYVEIVACLLTHGRIPLDAVDSLGGATALYWAADKGHAEVVRLLLQAGADPTIAHFNSLTPLTKAREGHHQDCITLLEVRG